jgi:hypothetical protein
VFAVAIYPHVIELICETSKFPPSLAGLLVENAKIHLGINGH